MTNLIAASDALYDLRSNIESMTFDDMALVLEGLHAGLPRQIAKPIRDLRKNIDNLGIIGIRDELDRIAGMLTDLIEGGAPTH